MFAGQYLGIPLRGIDFQSSFKLYWNNYLIIATPATVKVSHALLDDAPEWGPIVELVSLLWSAKLNCNITTKVGNEDSSFWNSSPAFGVTDYRVSYTSTEGIDCHVDVSLKGTTLVSLNAPDMGLRVIPTDQIPNTFHEGKVFSKTYRTARRNVKLSAESVLTASSIQYRSFEEIAQECPGEFDWLLEADYQLVTPETVRDVCREIMAHDGVVSFDTETTGLGITFKSIQESEDSDQVTGLVWSIREGQSFYMPLRHTLFPNVVPIEDISAFMEVYIKPILETKKIIAYNASFDSKVSMIYGIILSLFADVQSMHRITEWHITRGIPDPESGKMAQQPSLKIMTHHFLGRKSLELEMFLPSILRGTKDAWGKYGNFANLPARETTLYACADTDNTLRLYNLFIKLGWIDEYGASKTFSIENAFSNIIAYSEFFGIHVDVERIPELRKTLDAQEARLMGEMTRIAGKRFNPNSSAQLSSIMYDDLGYPILKRTPKGAPSTAKEVLADLASRKELDDNPLYPLASLMGEYRDVGTFRKNFLKAVDDLGTQDGFLFPSYQALLETGRISTSGPNIQGTPGFAKEYYSARDGYYVFDFDFSSVEYRLLASISGEKELIEFFLDPVKDYHRRQASVLFGIPYALVTYATRRLAKPLDFAIPYGKSDPSLGEALFGKVCPWNTKRASVMRGRYFAGQLHVEKFFQDANEEVSTPPHFVETYFGRRRYLDPTRLGFGNYRRGLAAAKRAAGNHKIQGVAADLFKMGMARLFNTIIKNGWFGKVLISAMVHDECVIEVHKSIAPWEILKAVTDSVCIQIPNWSPLFIGAGYGTSWGDAKDQDLPVGVQRMIMSYMDNPDAYDWDGDVNRWIERTEELRHQYMVDYVYDYLNDPTNYGEVIDPDVSDYAHKVTSSSGSRELYETLDDYFDKCNKELPYDHSLLPERVLPLVEDTTDFILVLDKEIADKELPNIAAKLQRTDWTAESFKRMLDEDYEGAPDFFLAAAVDMLQEAQGISLDLNAISEELANKVADPAPEDLADIPEAPSDSYPTNIPDYDKEIQLGVNTSGYHWLQVEEASILFSVRTKKVEEFFSTYNLPDGDVELVWIDPNTFQWSESGMKLSSANLKINIGLLSMVGTNNVTL